MSAPTFHNDAAQGDIAKTVLMPGDPLRAKLVADEYLSDVKCFNTVRNMLGFTGKFEGVEISVMGSGMGMPSIGIYSHELFNFYGVESIIRIGSAGAIMEQMKLGEVLLAMGACTNSSFASQFNLPGTFAPVADYHLLKTAEEKSRQMGIPVMIGSVLSSDTFYVDDIDRDIAWTKMGVLAVEMEAAALYMNAARFGKRALGIMTVSDNIITGERLDAASRQQGFHDMIRLALHTAVSV